MEIYTCKSHFPFQFIGSYRSLSMPGSLRARGKNIKNDVHFFIFSSSAVILFFIFRAVGVQLSSSFLYNSPLTIVAFFRAFLLYISVFNILHNRWKLNPLKPPLQVYNAYDYGGSNPSRLLFCSYAYISRPSGFVRSLIASIETTLQYFTFSVKRIRKYLLIY